MSLEEQLQYIQVVSSEIQFWICWFVYKYMYIPLCTYMYVYDVYLYVYDYKHILYMLQCTCM